MSHAPWHSGGTYTGANKDYDSKKGYASSQSNNNDNYSGQTILDDIDKAQATSAIENLVNNNQDLKNQAGNVVINDKFIKKGGVFEPGEENLPYDQMNSAQKAIYDFYNTGTNAYQQQMQGIKESPGGLAAFKEKFPNPLAKIAGGVMDAYQQFSPMAQIMQSLGNAGGDGVNMVKDITKPVVDKTKDVFESVKEFALSGPGEASETEDFDFITENVPVPEENIHTMKKGGIVHAADGVFAESETMEMPLTLPEIKRHRKKLEAGFQYDIEIDGKNKSFSFDEQIGPSGIAALRERENITPFDTGLNMYGGGQFAEGNTPEARQALEVLKSIDPSQPGNFHMQGGTALNYKANGGYMSSFPNQNLNTESLSASDNIDDRIMKNLQFEKMSPGMMGYNMGGVVEPVAPDFNTGI